MQQEKAKATFPKRMKAQSFLELSGKSWNSGMEPIFPKRKKRNFLQKAYKHNFMKFQVWYYISYYRQITIM